jgi:DNA polymerase-3 subunit beta
MKFTLQREQLLKPLQLVTGVVERRQTLPVLSNLLVQAGENGISLTGTDLEVEMVAHCNVEVQEAGEVTIPARKLADIWRSLPDGAEVSLSVEGERVTIRSGRSRFTLATLPASANGACGLNRPSVFCHGATRRKSVLKWHVAGNWQ